MFWVDGLFFAETPIWFYNIKGKMTKYAPVIKEILDCQYPNR